ncbi:hypothetical protein [Streptomyces niveus]
MSAPRDRTHETRSCQARKARAVTLLPLTAACGEPEADQTGFRVSWDITNGSKKPIGLDAWGFDIQGATTGGTTEPVFAENGSRLMGGRLAPAKTGTFTSEYALPKADGLDIVFTMTRMDESADILAEDPHWTGSIK